MPLVRPSTQVIMTILFLLMRCSPWKKVPGYILAQILGATAGAAIVYANYVVSSHTMSPNAYNTDPLTEPPPLDRSTERDQPLRRSSEPKDSHRQDLDGWTLQHIPSGIRDRRVRLLQRIHRHRHSPPHNPRHRGQEQHASTRRTQPSGPAVPGRGARRM